MLSRYDAQVLLLLMLYHHHHHAYSIRVSCHSIPVLYSEKNWCIFFFERASRDSVEGASVNTSWRWIYHVAALNLKLILHQFIVLSFYCCLMLILHQFIVLRVLLLSHADIAPVYFTQFLLLSHADIADIAPVYRTQSFTVVSC